ncbi:copper homeostasis protein CutC [Paenibacillus sp. HJL G12]|uniref:PF03932 family protein CutC n=1 Tax=Paenibacillus dendrobii TaxID=2691084 RepID=A0A7X3IHM6_9BACL|nr:copper homeostasis protein CutC [Paenibacillus dendrobii]MWV44094.1 copper homeostasis protein CutC [Paenibacillus dendrobii]
MKLEVIATNLTDALLAEQGGADRIELVTGILEGGLTPGPGLIKEAVRHLHIPVHVMVRPHSQSFVYDENDLQTMQQDIAFIKESGAAGIVVGALTSEGKVDTAALDLLLQDVAGINVTFHRAFDEIEDQLAALQLLARYPQINRILTSGGPLPAPKSVPQIKRLTEAAQSTGICILAGYGLSVPVLQDFAEATGVEEVHFGSALRMNGDNLQPVDPGRVRAAKQIIHDLHQGMTG